MSLRVALVEDDQGWRTSLESLLSETAGVECVGSYGTGEDAIRELPGQRAQIVLMDINLPKMSGVECTRQLRALLPELQIIMLTIYDDSDRIFQALQMGASGYLLKRASADEILQAIQDVNRGGAPMSPYIARKVVQSFQQQSPTARPEEGLSKRESEVLSYVARGYSDKEVAEALGLTSATVRSYLKSIYSKLHVHSRTQAILKAAKL
jgi:DNA-binding NarL/FixJ family response regulator